MLDEKEKDLYKVLGVSWNADLDEIKRAFFKLAKESHPDSNVDQEEKDKLHTRFLEINKAYNILKDPEKRKEYDLRLGLGNIKSEEEIEEKERRKEQAKLLFKRGLNDLNRGNYWNAIECFKICVNYNEREPNYLSFYGYALALSGNKRRLIEARDYCQRAIQIDRFNPTFYTHLGEVYVKANLKVKAIQSFKEALDLDSDNDYLKKRINELNSSTNGSKGGVSSIFSKLFGKKS